jgi:hypothetical protein
MYVIYLTVARSQLRHPAWWMESAMRDGLILATIWLGMFFGLTRAGRYPTLWAAAGASAATGFIGIYVFWVDWTPPLH